MLPSFFLALLLGAFGGLLLSLPLIPGELSNLIAWFETDGSILAMTVGLAITIATLLWIWHLLGQLWHNNTIIIHTLSCSIHKKVFQQLIQQLWKDYFHQEYHVSINIKKSGLEIQGEIPKEWDNKEELTEFLAKELFSQTGYWGPLTLILTHTT